MPFEIGLLLFPKVTQLDLTGPYEVFIRFPDTNVHLVSKTVDAVVADGGMRLLADGALKGAVGTGATLAATAQVAALGGPAGLALLAGVRAGVLAHQTTKNVRVAQIGRFMAERARAAAREFRGKARRNSRSPQRIAGPVRPIVRPARA